MVLQDEWLEAALQRISLRDEVARVADEDISTLQDVLDLELTQGIHAMDIPVIKADLEAAKAAVADLRKAWKGTRLRGWRFVQGGNNGIYRYFPTEDAVRLEKLLQTSNAGGAAEFIDRVRATVLTADTSPITGVQAPMSFLFDPYGASKQWIGGLAKSTASGNPFRAFSQTAFAEDIAEHLDEWQELFYYMGRAPTSRPEEMAGSFIESIPKIGGIVRRGNEDMYIGIIRRVKRMVDEERDSLMKHMGLSHDEATAAVVDAVTKVVPIQNTARLGQSGRQAQLARLPFTSIAFLRKPIEFNLDAARGFTKLLTKQTLTPRERLAVKFALTMASSVTAISVSTALYAADLRGLTPRLGVDACGTLVGGCLVQGTVEFPGQVRRFGFDAKAGDNVFFELVEGTGMDYMILEIFDPQGELLASAQSSGSAVVSIVDRQIPTDGTYSIRVRNNASDVGAFTLSLNKFGP
jgi:hypothetical protein